MDIDFVSLGFKTNFSVLDWCIAIGYIIIVVSIGVYIRKYVASATDFIVAGRDLKTFLGAATMIATELCLVTVSLLGVALLVAVLTESLKVLRMMGPDPHRIIPPVSSRVCRISEASATLF